MRMRGKEKDKSPWNCSLKGQVFCRQGNRAAPARGRSVKDSEPSKGCAAWHWRRLPGRELYAHLKWRLVGLGGRKAKERLNLRQLEKIVNRTEQRLSRWRQSSGKPGSSFGAAAIVWGGRAAVDMLGQGSPKRKPHGYFAKSWFRIGFDQIRNLLASDDIAAIKPWKRLTKPAQNRGVV